jgi:hypothetical protein
MKGNIKIKNHYIFIGAIASVLIISFFAGQRAYTQPDGTSESKEDQTNKVKAYIDDKCGQHTAKIIVAEGKTAFKFSAGDLVPGKACHDGGEPDNKGYDIRDSKNRIMYLWSQYKDLTPYEKGGPLPELELAAGEYSVSVAGGSGAEIEISYFIK